VSFTLFSGPGGYKKRLHEMKKFVDPNGERIRGVRIGKLTSVARIGAEIGRIYRHMRREELNTADGKRMAEVLLGMKACLETSEIERKIAELEALILAQQQANVVTPFRRAS
jgi:hypothetical protein